VPINKPSLPETLPGGRRQGEVVICGLGLRPEHLTLETIQALKKCDAIFHRLPGRETVRQVRSLCGGLAADAFVRYAPGGERGLPAKIVAAAARGKTVALLRQGHPLAGRRAADSLQGLCAAEGVACRVIPALSPLDDILTSVGTPVMRRGLQVHHAGAIGRRTPLHPSVPAVIMSLDELWKNGRGGPARLAGRLAKVYPPGHRLALIRCPDAADGSALRLETDLRSLPRALRGLGAGRRGSAALFIPWLEASGLDWREADGAAPAEGGRVIICGLGLRVEQMTLETLRVLKKCDVVFHDFLDGRAVARLRPLCRDLRDLNRLRADESEKATTDVILSALAPGRTVAFLCYGHPMVLQWTAVHLIRRCRADGIPCATVSAMTALDDILVDAGVPVMDLGLQLCLPNRALELDLPLLPHVPTAVMLLSHLWTVRGGVRKFARYLGRYYRPDQPVIIVRSSRVVKDPVLRQATTLRGLAAALNRLPLKERFNASLLLPAGNKP